MKKKNEFGLIISQIFQTFDPDVMFFILVLLFLIGMGIYYILNKFLLIHI